MRIRQWLLTGTSLAAFTFMPAAAMAQQAEYQALQEAQAAGDQGAIDAARQAFLEACIAAGFANEDACIAAVQGGDQPPAAEEPAPAPEPEPAPAEEPPPPAEEPAPVEEPAPPAEEPPPPPVEEPAPAPAEEPAPAPEEPAPAVEQQQAPAAEEPGPAAEEPAPAAEEPAPAEPAGPTPEEQQAQFVADLQAALDQYQAALNQAASGDYAGAQAAAAAAEARILELCTTNGYPDIKSCIGQDLPPLPAPPAEQPAAPAEEAPPADAAPAAPAEPAAETPAEPAAEQPAEQAPADQPAEQGAEVGPETPAVEPSAEDPAAAAQARLQTAVELYNVGISQLDAGDPSGQSTIDAANRQFAEICAGLGQNDVAACLAQYGIELAPVPPVPEPAAPATPPIADLPGANEAVTPDAVEVLPEAVAPEAAAPILDSAKDFQAIVTEGGEPPAEQPAAPVEPPAPPPADDQAAQAALAPVEVQSLKETQGEAITADALAPIEVPQNVTIINNITNVNVTNNTTNNTVINNGDGRPGKPRPDYANNGFIFNIGVNLVIQNNDFDRLSNDDEDDVEYQRLPGGRIKETITRPNGVEIVTIRNRYGEVLKRSRITPDGREYILAYYDEDEDRDDDFTNWRDPGRDLPPLRLTIPIRDYILDADDSDEEEVELFFRQPPVEPVREIYTIDDVKKSARLRDSVRRIEIGGLTFDSGAATISRSQVGALSKVANAMLALLEDNPAETFLIEGHTDAVGGDQPNLILSDARATTVARILTDFYDVPPENLVTQGYGERFLKVKTEQAEPLNRRVAVKRITPLITLANR